MSFDNHEIVQKYFEKNPEICNHYLNNRKEVEENWRKISSHKDLETVSKAGEIKLVKEKVVEEYIREIIIEEGKKTLKRWKIIKYVSFFGAIAFLVVLYLMFWYITSDFIIIQESFSNLFCVS